MLKLEILYFFMFGFLNFFSILRIFLHLYRKNTKIWKNTEIKNLFNNAYKKLSILEIKEI